MTATKSDSAYLLVRAFSIFDNSKVHISSIKPSAWAESNIIMQGNLAGALNYSNSTPYCKDIIDDFSPYSPITHIAIMGAAQWGKTSAIVIPVLGYIMANCPGNVVMTVGHEDLIEEAMGKLDYMLDTTGLRKLVKSNALRAKAQKSGDTNRIKEFPNGYIKIAHASNHKIWRQSDYRYIIVDDFDAVKMASKEAGSTMKLIEKRATSYGNKKKVCFISSPEIKGSSNIETAYELGDCRKFFVPCPCCGDFIEILWYTTMADGEPAGMTWKVDDDGLLIQNSVRYKCQSCGDLFKEREKPKIMKQGFWKPTKKPSHPNFRSYHMNSLYAPAGMDDWNYYVNFWISIHKDGKRDEAQYKTFLNTTLGQSYEVETEPLDAKALQKNVSDYRVSTVPEKLSNIHGNGNIVMLTCAADLGGKIEDARLDYEIVAWTESGSSFSIKHGSIGTFVRERYKTLQQADRKVYSYDLSKPNNVWKEFIQVLRKKYVTDTGREMGIVTGAIDSGHFTNYVYNFIEKSGVKHLYAIKGDGKGDYTRLNSSNYYKQGQEQSYLYILKVGVIKDMIAENMRLAYGGGFGEMQPSGFMNYPYSQNGLYEYRNFFSHYEAEERRGVVSSTGGLVYRWEVKNSMENHFFDVRGYNIFAKDLYTKMYCKENGVNQWSWKALVDIFRAQRKR